MPDRSPQKPSGKKPGKSLKEKRQAKKEKREERDHKADRLGSGTLTVSVRIAVLAPIAWRVPPRHYGPWELFASLLTEGLVARGHDVTLFATGDSETSARLRSVVPRSWSEDRDIDPKVAECLHISEVFERASEFDVIHNSFDFLPLTYSGLISTPVVTTIHGFSSPQIVPVYAKYNHKVVLCRDQRCRQASRRWTTWPPSITGSTPEPSPSMRRLAPTWRSSDASTRTREWSPRSTPPKNRESRFGLRASFRTRSTSSDEIVPRLDGDRVQFIGSVRAEDRSSFLGGAIALLHLIDFDEPFGLSVVEAMACGTPVIAFDRGSMSEIISDGTTGFLVADVASAAEAIRRVGQLDRQTIRDVAVRRFSSDRMVDEYVAVYRYAIAEFESRSSRCVNSTSG